jgi:hypothetical protein
MVRFFTLVYIIRIIGNICLEKGERGFRFCFIIKRIC